jgi:sulfofructose kinase
VSAIKCTRLGGRAGIPSAAVAQRFIDTGAIDYTEIDKRVEMYRNRLE